MSEADTLVLKQRPPLLPPFVDEQGKDSSPTYNRPTLEPSSPNPDVDAEDTDDDTYTIHVHEPRPNKSNLEKTSPVSSDPSRTPMSKRPLLSDKNHKIDHMKQEKKSSSMSEADALVFKHRPPPLPPFNDKQGEDSSSTYLILDPSSPIPDVDAEDTDDDTYTIHEPCPNKSNLEKTQSLSLDPPRMSKKPLPSVPSDRSQPNYLPMTASGSSSGSPNDRFSAPGTDVDSDSSHSKNDVFMHSNKPKYVKITQKEMGKILDKGQTAEDFYRLGVAQLSHLLFYCNLSHIGELCFNHNLDGAFFKNMDLNILKEDPFNGTILDMKKFEKIMSGWRPNLN